MSGGRNIDVDRLIALNDRLSHENVHVTILPHDVIRAPFCFTIDERDQISWKQELEAQGIPYLMGVQMNTKMET